MKGVDEALRQAFQKIWMCRSSIAEASQAYHVWLNARKLMSMELRFALAAF